MGIVYAGVHPVIGKEVAIKVLDPRLATSAAVVERFEREARAVNTIEHPNIIDIFAFGHSPELGHYFVMPRLRGQSLGDRIAVAPMTLDEALPIVAEIADALTAAHAAGVAHRDLKPDNVFLVSDRRGGCTAQLLDFGIAKLMDGDPGTATRSGVQLGTPLFMAPEQWDAAGIDHRADIYALGIIVHHMLTGRYPFESTSPLALMNLHGNAAPTLPSAFGGPPSVDPVVARALAKDKAQRFQSAAELLDALRAAAGLTEARALPHARAHATGSSASLSAMAPARSGRRLAVVFLAVGVSTAGVVAAVLRGRGHPAEAAGAGGALIDAAARGGERPAETAGAGGALVDAAAPDADEVDAASSAARASSEEPAVPTAPTDARRAPSSRDARGRSPSPRVEPARPPEGPARPTGTRDAGAPRRRVDASWGATVDPFAEDQP